MNPTLLVFVVVSFGVSESVSPPGLLNLLTETAEDILHHFEEVQATVDSLNTSVYAILSRLDAFEARFSKYILYPRQVRQHFLRGYWSWNIFYGQSLASAHSRRAVVSFWRKDVHKTWLTA